MAVLKVWWQCWFFNNRLVLLYLVAVDTVLFFFFFLLSFSLHVFVAVALFASALYNQKFYIAITESKIFTHVYPEKNILCFFVLNKAMTQVCCVYPGTHWVAEILHMLTSGATEYSGRIKAYTMLEFCNDLTFLDTLTSPRLLNSHLYMAQLPRGMVDKKVKVKSKGLGSSLNLIIFLFLSALCLFMLLSLIYMYVCMYKCLYIYIHMSSNVCLSPSFSVCLSLSLLVALPFYFFIYRCVPSI